MNIASVNASRLEGAPFVGRTISSSDPLPDRVVVINDFSVACGGASSIALASLEMLNSLGVETTFVAGDNGAAADPRLSNGFVALGGKHILKGTALGSGFSGLYNASAARQVMRWIANNDTPRTVYHLHGWSKILSPAIFQALRPVSRRLVITAHDFFLVCPNGGYFNYKSQSTCKLKPMGISCFLTACDRRSHTHKVWRWTRQVIRQALYDLDGVGMVLAVHDGMIPDLIRGGVPVDRVCALRNPVLPWRRARVEAESNRLFLFVGRIEEEKGVDLLASAARKAGVRLGIIGHGSLQPRLAAAFPEAQQLGWKSRADIGELIGGARALVIPTRCPETFSLVAIEALASGVPVVVPPNAMLADEIVAAGFGLACDPHNEGALAAVLLRLDRDDALVSLISRRAHAGAAHLACTPSEWAEGLLSIYRSVLDHMETD